MSTDDKTLHSVIQINGGTNPPGGLYERELYISSDGTLYVGGHDSKMSPTQLRSSHKINAGSAELLIGKRTELYGTSLPTEVASFRTGQVFFLIEE